MTGTQKDVLKEIATKAKNLSEEEKIFLEGLLTGLEFAKEKDKGEE